MLHRNVHRCLEAGTSVLRINGAWSSQSDSTRTGIVNQTQAPAQLPGALARPASMPVRSRAPAKTAAPVPVRNPYGSALATDLESRSPARRPALPACGPAAAATRAAPVAGRRVAATVNCGSSFTISRGSLTRWFRARGCEPKSSMATRTLQSTMRCRIATAASGFSFSALSGTSNMSCEGSAPLAKASAAIAATISGL